MSKLHEELAKYRKLGWRTVPIRAGTKKFKTKGTSFPQDIKVVWADIREHEWKDEDYDPGDNVGLDPASANLVDVDLDCWEAFAVGKMFMPDPAPYSFGRNGKPLSHLIYPCADAPFPEEDVKLVWQGETLLELRTGASGHTRLPPSIHVEEMEDGTTLTEGVIWDNFAEDGEKLEPVKWEHLRRRASLIAVTTMIVRNYPAKGARHSWGLALWGALRQLGVTLEEAELIQTAIKRIGPQDNDTDNRRDELSSTYNLDEDQATSGLSHLKKFDPSFVSALKKFIGGTVTIRGFIANANGGPNARNPKNYLIALERDGYTFSLDNFASVNLMQQGTRQRPLDDAVINNARLQINDSYKFLPSKDLFFDVIYDECWKNRFNPVRNYLDELHWDGIERLDAWLVIYAGAKDDEYTRTVGRITLAASVKRIFDPGCKFDQLLVLEGIQGSGKSSSIRALCPRAEWFTDSLPIGADPQRVIEATKGKWLVEIPELFGMSKREVDTVKAFLSRQNDEARKAYGREPERRSRMFVCIGSTNKDVYLSDPTGNRRFWPVAVSDKQDVEGLLGARDQLWAEAVALVRNGESLVLPEHLWSVAEAHQTLRSHQDPWEELIQAQLSNPRPDWVHRKFHVGDLSFTTPEILSSTGKDSAQWDINDARRVGDLLKKLGCTRQQIRRGNKKIQGWNLTIGRQRDLGLYKKDGDDDEDDL